MLSFTQQDYPIDFTPTVPIYPANHTGTLRMNMGSSMVPPPDVTHHTTHTLPQIPEMPPAMPLQKPPGILKDPNKRANMINNVSSNAQILNVKNMGNGNGLPLGVGQGLMHNSAAYDQHNLSSFNAQMGYTDDDGHLV